MRREREDKSVFTTRELKQGLGSTDRKETG